MRPSFLCRVLPLLLLLASCATSAERKHEASSANAVPRGAEHPLARRELNVGLVVVEGVYNTELTAPMDILHHTVFHVEPGMKVFTTAPTTEPLRSFEGLVLVPDYAFADAPRIDVLVVPSALHSMDSDLENEELIRFVRERGEAADFVMSLCDGAFVLAQAGLLDGLHTTTFPADREALAERFPGLTVHHDARFVHDGKAITSVGGAPSFEPALYLCELLYGAEKTRGIAKGLVIDWDLTAIPHKISPQRSSK